MRNSRILQIRALSLILVLILHSLFFVNCTKPNKIKWVYYDQTECADKWGSYTNNEDLKAKITDYFSSKNIDVYDIEIFLDGTKDNCLDCTCRTGKRIKLKIRKKDLEEIKKEGFYE